MFITTGYSHFSRLGFQLGNYPIHYFGIFMRNFCVINIPTYCTLLALDFLLDTHGSYVFKVKPRSLRQSRNVSYHKSDDCIQPYNTLVSCKYNVLFLHPYITNLLKLGLTWHMMVTVSSVIFTKTKSFMSASRYTQTISAVATSCFSLASISSVFIKLKLHRW